MKIKVLGSPTEVSKEIVNDILFLLPKIRTIGLATGQTMIPIYQEWTSRLSASLDIYSHIDWYLLDEFIGLPHDHPDLYQKFIFDNFVNPLKISISKLHFPNFTTAPDKAALDYENQILGCGGLDLQLLGIGGNGHIGLNEPGSSILDKTRIVKLHEKTQLHHQKFSQDKNIVPELALTQGISTILKHKKIFLIALGKSKSEIIKQFFLSRPTSDLPARILKTHQDLTIYLDEEAASLSREEIGKIVI